MHGKCEFERSLEGEVATPYKKFAGTFLGTTTIIGELRAGFMQASIIDPDHGRTRDRDC